MISNAVSIVESIKEHALLTPDRLCVGDKKNKATYKEFWTMVQRGATYLKSNGVQKGDVVVIRGMNKLEFLLAEFSVQLMGAIACPLEKAVKEDRILEIMDFVDSNIYLSDRAVKNPRVNNISLKEMFKAVSDNENPMETETFEFPKSQDVCEILFTTGTTGKSKGIEITNRNNIAVAQNVIDGVQMGDNETELVTAPINHSLAIRRTYASLYNGCSVVLTDGIKFVEDFFRLLDDYRITAITFVPAILEQVLKFAKDRFATYRDQLDYIQLGSAPLTESNKKILTDMFPNVRLYNTYGATESGVTVALEFSKYGNKDKCIGKLTKNAQVVFADKERNVVDASLENPGYLAFAGPMNMKGYYKEPEITAEVLDDKGIVYTNDLGYMGEDGMIYLLGRQGEVINMGGIKISPMEIEDVVNAHEMIKECACIPIPDDITGEAPKLFVVLNEGYDFDQKALSKYMLDKLESIKVPKVFQVIDQIPRTFNGKILRRQLKELNSDE